MARYLMEVALAVLLVLAGGCCCVTCVFLVAAGCRVFCGAVARW